jgi:uncharacterized membrane protein YobD (UPF0266 family)
MMPISTKLNLLILALPISSIVFVFLVGFYFYRGSLDASAFATAVSSLTSAILVILLVWERLRDSLSKKLEYVHKNFLFKLYSKFPYLNLFWSQDDVYQIKLDMDRYAKFLGLKLYSQNLMKSIEGFLASHKEFFKKYEEIEKLAMNLMEIKNPANLYRDLLQYHMGLASYHPSYDLSVEENYIGTSQTITKENPQLVAETKAYLQKTEESATQIFHELQDFLKSNNLRLEQESAAA